MAAASSPRACPSGSLLGAPPRPAPRPGSAGPTGIPSVLHANVLGVRSLVTLALALWPTLLYKKAQLAKCMHFGALEATKQLRGGASRTNPTCWKQRL